MKTLKIHNLTKGWVAAHFDKRLPTEKMVVAKTDRTEVISLPKRSLDTLRAIFNSQNN